jgi:hypothetical protein
MLSRLVEPILYDSDIPNRSVSEENAPVGVLTELLRRSRAFRSFSICKSQTVNARLTEL